MFLNTGRVAQSVQRLATSWTVWGSNPGGGEIFRTCPDRPWGPPSLLQNGYRVFAGCKKRPVRDADPSPTSSAVVKEGQSYTSPPHMGRTACTEPQCLHKGRIKECLEILLCQPVYTLGKQQPNTGKFSNKLMLQPSGFIHQIRGKHTVDTEEFLWAFATCIYNG